MKWCNKGANIQPSSLAMSMIGEGNLQRLRGLTAGRGIQIHVGAIEVATVVRVDLLYIKTPLPAQPLKIETALKAYNNKENPYYSTVTREFGAKQLF